MQRLAEAVLPLSIAAAALALLAPSGVVAGRADLLLAALVALTALGIAPADLAGVSRRAPLVLALAVVPFVVLVPLAWALSRLFDGAVRDGVLVLGLAPTEVTAAGLVALATGEAALALAVVACSLVVSAVAGPLLVVALADGADADGAALLGRFALVVLLPLALGLIARAALPRIARAEPGLAGAATLVLAALVYASLSETGTDDLGQAALGGAVFLIACAPLAWVALRSPAGATGAFAIGMRDFAVAAALAAEAFGPEAAGVAGAYGVLMLIAGAGAAAALRRRRQGAAHDRS